MAKNGTRAPSGRPSRVDDDTVLAAAASLFQARGFAGTTVRDVARAAGLLPGSLHYRYPTKESLLLALMERAVSAGENTVKAAVARVADPVERVRQGLRAHVRLLVEDGPLAIVLLHDWRALTGDARAAMLRLRDRYDRFWARLLQEAARDVPLQPGVDLRLLRLLGFGALNGVAQWYRADGPATPDAIADAFLEAMAHGIVRR